MARRSKRITRKDIRRPDPFMVYVGDLLDFLSQHRTPLVAASLLLLIILLGLWLWGLHNATQDRLATEHYSRALNLYHAGRYHEALDAFKQVGTYRSSAYKRLALLQQANVFIALNETNNAATALKEFLAAEKKEPLLRQIALLTLGQTQELSGNCKAALENYIAAEKILAPLKEEAMLSTARCSVQNSDLKQALATYRSYLSEFPGSPRISEIMIRVQDLEGKIKERS